MERLKRYFYHIAIALDQLFNAICGGFSDETLSSCLFRNRNKNKFNYVMFTLVNFIFFWQDNHCYQSYKSEVDRKHLPSDLKN